MKRRPIDVILPAKNAVSTVRQSVISVLAQTFGAFRLIFVDDASTDGTLDAVLAVADDRVFVIRRRKSTGMAAALNAGLAASSAPWIFRMDADDISLPERFRTQYELCQTGRYDVIGSWAYRINTSGVRMGLMTCPETHETLVQNMWRRNPFIHPTVAIRGQIARTRGYDSSMSGSMSAAEDYDLWFRLYRTATFYNIQEPLLEYRCANRGLSKRLRHARYSAAAKYRAIKREGRGPTYHWYWMRNYLSLLSPMS